MWTLIAGVETARAHIETIFGPHVVPSIDWRVLEDGETIAGLIRQVAESGLDVVMSCLPYSMNYDTAQAAIENKVHYADLGGHIHTSIAIREELGLQAEQAGVLLVTDNGLAPGLCNILAVDGISHFQEITDVVVHCGGLPQLGWLPWRFGVWLYQWIFSPAGVIGNYFDGPSWAIIKGVFLDVAPLTLQETGMRIRGVWHQLTSASTEGALGFLPLKYKGRVQNMIYKTWRYRYRGHWKQVKSLDALGWFENAEENAFPFDSPVITPRQMTERVLERQGLTFNRLPRTDRRQIIGLGLLSDKPYTFKSSLITPRELFVRAAGRPNMYTLRPDLVAMRVEVTGRQANGKRSKVTYEMVDRYDPDKKITAMARTTGYTFAAMALLMADGTITARGHVPVEDAVEGMAHQIIERLSWRGISIRKSISALPEAA